jgi:hypothetical protein
MVENTTFNVAKACRSGGAVSGKAGREPAERLDKAKASFPPQDRQQFYVESFYRPVL